VEVFGLPSKTHFFTAGQIHSDAISNSDAAELPAAGAAHKLPDCDALISTRAGTALAIRTADCLPILFFEPQQQIIAAVHAGWRGIANEIAAKTVQKIIKLGGDPKRILAWVGPSIGSCCFDVQSDLATKFQTAVSQRDGKQFVDLKKIARGHLLDSGLQAKNISWTDHCTCCEPDLFASHRREGAARTNVQWSIIALPGG